MYNCISNSVSKCYDFTDLVQNVFLPCTHTCIFSFYLDPLKSDDNYFVLILTVGVVLESTMKQEYVRCAEKIAWSISFEKFCTDSNSALLPARRDNLGSMQFKACICICIFGNINRIMRFVQGGGAKSDLPNNSYITIVVNQIFSPIRYFSLSLYTTTPFNITLGNMGVLFSTLQLPLFLTGILLEAYFLDAFHKS